MKQVLFVITGLGFGGAETQVVHLATRLKARGWDVRVVSLTPPKAYVQELEAAGVPVISLGIRGKVPDPRPVFRLAKMIRTWRPQVVHSHMVHANLVARLVRLLAPVPVLVCTAHSIDEKGRRGSGRLRGTAYRLTDPLCDLTTQVSRAGLERYVRIGAVPQHKIRYLPNGIDTERFRPDPQFRAHLRQELGLETAFGWLAVGRFDVAKDYPNMLQAFSRVAQERPEAQLLIAGDGPLRPSMEQLASDLGITDRVKFLGIRRDIPALMNAADAYVMSSAWEGMPNVLLEAAASGLPIVATDVGGNSEVVIDSKTGFLVPPKDPEALAQVMVWLMDLSQGERRRVGEAARQHIVANYSLDHVVDQWEALYRELLAQKGVRVE
ncbi:MAG TPA: glycosyltransferase [Candidatus Bipolaricaulis sp.]|nr:glycosyltransferase [Candidatus Bipolaricaulis sp.]HRS13554.1 glycosyltransferase [Candidatus Bipolaricaulis sp.]HRU22016.1 glycosyltransferase [Candidatus Bipolaricaulis sp.]